MAAGGTRAFWKRLWGTLHAPKVSDERLEQYLRQVRHRLPIPVFWLLGKAQSGKTSLIRALTGSTRLEIGNGFRPCTRSSQLYAFPDEKDCFLKFLDTRGLGEVDYDPAEDIRVLENQSHCLIVVLKAMDHAQQSVSEALARCRPCTAPDWPVIVVQTALHEGYPWSEPRHVLPYPYGELPLPAAVPRDLARSLGVQRELFARWAASARFVPVDFTLPEDGYEPEHYGLDALWAALEDALPLGLRAMLRTGEARRPLRDIYFRAAQPHILSFALAAGAAASVPLPLVDIPLFLALQAKMFHTLASLYGQQMKFRRMTEVLGTLGLGISARLGGRELLKIIPGFGSAVSALFAAASTYSLGCTLAAYFSFALDGDIPDPAVLRKLYREQYEEGRRRLREYLGHVGRGV